MKRPTSLMVANPLDIAESFLELDVGWIKTLRGDGSVLLERPLAALGKTMVVLLYPEDWPRNADGRPMPPPARLLNS